MDEKDMRNLLSGRLYIELQIFRYSVLQCTKEEIYSKSFKIETFVNMYEILLEDIQNLNEETAYKLLMQNDGILEFLYQEWLAREDSILDELKLHVDEELLKIIQKDEVDSGKEHEDGECFDKAA